MPGLPSVFRLSYLIQVSLQLCFFSSSLAPKTLHQTNEELHINQPMVNCWFEAWWFGILGVYPSNNPFHKGVPGIQTTNPNQQLTISWKQPSKKTKHHIKIRHCHLSSHISKALMLFNHLLSSTLFVQPASTSSSLNWLCRSILKLLMFFQLHQTRPWPSLSGCKAENIDVPFGFTNISLIPSTSNCSLLALSACATACRAQRMIYEKIAS